MNEKIKHDMKKHVKKQDVIKQLEAISKEFGIIAANMNILKNYFKILIDFYKDEKFFE